MAQKMHTINADGKILGRVASEVAHLLMGKDSPAFLPHVLASVHVKIINTDKIATTGKKHTQKMYYRHSGRIGNLKAQRLDEAMARDSRRVLYYAVWNMLPKNKLRKKRLKNLKMYKGEK